MKTEQLKFYISHSRPYLVGCGKFKNRNVFGVNPGDLISIVGELTPNGKISSSCRRDVYDNPVIYVGTVDFDDSEWMIFKIDKKDHRIDLEGNNLYTMYIIIETEQGMLVVPNYEALTTLAFHPVFQKVGKTQEVLQFSDSQIILTQF